MLNSVKEVFVKEIEVSDIKEVLLQEINVKELKESLVREVKELLLKEIDVAEIKKMLLSEIDVKDLFSDRRKRSRNTEMTTPPLEVDTVPEENVASKDKDVATPEQVLVESLKKEHQEMLFLYDKIMQKSREKSYTTLPVLIARFSTKCLYHFNTEEELYSSIKALASNRSQLEMKVAAEFSMEMKNLSDSISSILSKGNNVPVCDETVNDFINEFSWLGEKLYLRINREESVLFPMYENSRKVVDIH